MLTLSVALEANISGLEVVTYLHHGITNSVRLHRSSVELKLCSKRVPRSPVFVKILLWGGCALLGGAMASVSMRH